MEGEVSELIQAHIPCPECGSSDAASLYSDGHIYCFACSENYSPRKLKALGYEVSDDDLARYASTYQSSGANRTRQERPRMSEDLAHLIETSTVQGLPRRGLTQATASYWDYRVRINSHGEGEHIAVYRDEHGSPVAAKVRNLGKDGTGKEFTWVGDPKAASLYGIHLVGKQGKKLIVCEGEIDTLTVSQLWANKFPVVGIPNGAATAKKDLSKHLELLSRFEEVVLCFDMDEPGRDALVACAKMLPPGKASLVQLPRKDPNEMLLAGETSELINAIHRASPYRPAGVVSAQDLKERAREAPAWGYRMGIDFLDGLQWGWRDTEIIISGAGTGMGKSDTAMQVCAHLTRVEGVRCAFFNFESAPEITLKGIAGKNRGRRFDRPDPEGIYWTQPELDDALREVVEDNALLYINDDDMPTGWDAFEERVRYLHHAFGITRFFGDPMAAFSADMDDERKGIDRMMAHAKALCKELRIGMWFNSHLARPKEGPSHEEGGQVRMSQFRGSGAITMWADLVFGTERDQQAEDPEVRALTTMRALKVRKAGEKAGLTDTFVYNVLSGILEPARMKLEQVTGLEEAPEAEPFEGFEQ